MRVANLCTFVYLLDMRHRTSFTPDPLGIFFTWTTYGSWLPGDARGWTDKAGAIRTPNHRLVTRARACLHDNPVRLSPCQREHVEDIIRRHCDLRGWHLHAVACRSQHVHVVLTATTASPAQVCQQLKAWAARSLHDYNETPAHIWSRGYSGRRLYDAHGLAAVVQYVIECQDQPH